MTTLTKKRPDVQLDKRDIKTQIAEATEFFSNPELNFPGKIKDGDDPYADKDGLIEFICGVELVNDPLVTAKLVELKSLLISITTVVTSYINRYSEKYGPEFKTDAELWALALSKIPLMGPSKLDTQTYSRRTKGVEIAADFINLVLDIAAGEGSALNSFKSFLEKQGGALRAGIEKNKDYYKTITVGIAVEVFKMGNQLIFIPKVKQYRVDFSRENTKWSSSCASFEEVDINFNYVYGANVFDYEALKDGEIKKAFDDFIKGSRKAQIDNASTFFNDDFDAPEVQER